MSQRQLPSASVLEQAMLGAVALALVAMLSLPAARGVSEVFGWLPFWLLALPLSAWAVARTLRRRSNRARVMPMATVHAIGAARVSRVREALPRAA
ncbi:MAG: hypothetical protein NT117_00080 [Gammaproteobacteria bacterium]|nr:hypothetical protein [Gammaproteobacteria bacterium]